jgi:hypothetical protein
LKKDRLEELTVSDYQDLVDGWIKTLRKRLCGIKTAKETTLSYSLLLIME